MTVRTKRLAAGIVNTLNTFVTVFTCPPGRTAIVKDLRSANTGPAESLVIWAAASGANQTRLINATVPVGSPTFASVYVVLEPGDELRLLSVAGSVTFHVSGSLLDGVAV